MTKDLLNTNILPLAGLNIVVTRPREQAAQLEKGIARLGGNCIQFPLLEIIPLADDRPLRAIATRLHEFQMAIFISPNAVRYAMQVIQKAGGLPASVQIVTVGLGSAKALQDLGVKKVISPHLKFDSEALLAIPELNVVNDKYIVIFRGDSGRELLGDTLKSRGAKVEYVTCYHRSKPQHDVTTLLAAKPDALSVSSSEALNNLWDMSSLSDRERFAVMPLFVSHPRIAAAAQKLGWRNVITTVPGDEGLLAGLVTWATHTKGKNDERRQQ